MPLTLSSKFGREWVAIDWAKLGVLPPLSHEQSLRAIDMWLTQIKQRHPNQYKPHERIEAIEMNQQFRDKIRKKEIRDKRTTINNICKIITANFSVKRVMNKPARYNASLYLDKYNLIHVRYSIRKSKFDKDINTILAFILGKTNVFLFCSYRGECHVPVEQFNQLVDNEIPFEASFSEMSVYNIIEFDDTVSLQIPSHSTN